MANPVKDSLRTAIFAKENKKRKSEIINIFGNQVEVRQPTLGGIIKLTQETTISPIIKVLVEYCFVPETDEKLFSLADADSLMSLPSGQWLNDLNDAINRMTGVDIKEAEKNSEMTT